MARDLPRARLSAHRLQRERFASPESLFQSQVAIQAQDYPGAKWALGLRIEGVTDGSLDQALAEGRFLRTHVLRPTWHLVAPDDLRWLLELTSPRVHATNGYQYRQLGYTAATFRKSQTALAKALRGGRSITRVEAREVFAGAGLDVSTSFHVLVLLMAAELDSMLVSGAMRGKHHTYALLDERVPATAPRARVEAIGELAQRYLASRGPATLADFAWWAGLTLTDAAEARPALASGFAQAAIGGETYWWSDTAPPANTAGGVWLLPNYDEFLVAYTDRSASLGGVPAEHLDARGNILFNHTLLIDGRVRGIWLRTIATKYVQLEVIPFKALSAATRRAVESAAERYGAFLGRPIRLQIR